MSSLLFPASRVLSPHIPETAHSICIPQSNQFTQLAKMAASLSTNEIRYLSIGVVAFSLFYYYLTKFLRRGHIRRVEAENGAKPPIWLTDVWKPKNGGLVWETITAIREHRWLDLINARHEAGGYTYQTTAIFGHFYHTSEPENIKAMLATKFEDWALGNRMPAVGPLLGGGVFTNDGDHWKVSRSLVRPSFVRAEISDMSMLEKHVQQLFAHIPKDGSTFDLQEMFLKLACKFAQSVNGKNSLIRIIVDYSSEFLFGESVQTFTSSANSPQAKFAAAFDGATDEIPTRLLFGKLLPVYDAFSFKFHRNCKTVHRFVDDLIARARARSTERAQKHLKDDEKDRCIFLEGLMDAISDDVQLRWELLNMLMAGRDTTSGLLSHVFYLLARRPDVYAKLHAEVSELNGRLPTYEHLKTMRYLRHVLNESKS